MIKYIARYTDSERINHWLVAICFVLAALSGLALFHPSMFWLVNLFGGGPWTRILHPFIGVVMFLGFLAPALRYWRQNRLAANDWKWLEQWRDVVNDRVDRLPVVGRYNAGQKIVFWVTVACVATQIVTGLISWRPYFAYAFPIGLVRLATLIHSIAAVVLILNIILHVYGAIWVKGTFRGMLRGYVSEAWAKKHHPGWYREVSQ
jgi:formate dehydrogenase subunit gamma